MEQLKQVKIGNDNYWLVEGHTLSEGAMIEVNVNGQWKRVKHVKGRLVSNHWTLSLKGM